MSKTIILLALLLSLISVANAQRDTTEEPTADLTFLVIKDDNGKPVRNAAVIMHPVENNGKQARGGMEKPPLTAFPTASCGCRCWLLDFRRSARTTMSTIQS
jgi:hypothetical protein